MYVGLENADAAATIDTLENKVIATIALGQAPQGVVYVPNAVPQGDGTQNLRPLGAAAKSVQLTLAVQDGKVATQVTLFDQGIVQSCRLPSLDCRPSSRSSWRRDIVLFANANPDLFTVGRKECFVRV